MGDTSLAIATGRVVGAEGQPSLTGYYKEKGSKPDHVLLSSGVYKRAKWFEMGAEQSVKCER